jgi:hypothetical protein
LCRRGDPQPSPRLHQLIRQHGRVTERTFEMTFLDPGVQTFSFTFGYGLSTRC